MTAPSTEPGPTGSDVGALYPAGRLDEVRERAAAAGYDALLLGPGAELRYITGYDAHESERLTCLVLPVRGDPLLVVPLLERPMAAAAPAVAAGVEVAGWTEVDDPFRLVADRLGGHLRAAPTVVGVSDRMWAEQVLRFAELLRPAELRTAGAVLSPLRMRKSPAEIAALERAGAAIDRVHAGMGAWLRAGRTERAVGRDIADAILTEGHVRVDFTIVGSGPNAASPHHHLSDRVIEVGDVVVVDIGGTTEEGYCSDCTRTYVVGGPAPAEVVDYYAVLAEAQEAGVRAVGPGVPAEEVDSVARDHIAAAGWGEFFVHRTGHGIGLQAHEEPYLVAGNPLPLEAGMVFSVEPGIYLPERSGARIEDIVVCTVDGVRRLNHRPRELVILDF